MCAAFEVDGRDVHRPSYRGTLVSNHAKFTALGIGPCKVQILYSLKNDLSPKPSLRGVGDPAAVAALLPNDVNVVLDEALFDDAPRAIVGDNGIGLRQALGLRPA